MLILNRPWDSQPQDAAFNAAHPLLALPGATLVDFQSLRSSRGLAVDGGTGRISSKPGSNGVGRGFSVAPATNDGRAITLPFAVDQSTSATTVIVFGSVGSTATEEHMVSWQPTGSSNLGQFNFGVVGTPKKLRLECRLSGPAWVSAFSAKTIVAGQNYLFAGTHQQGSGGGTKVYVDGVLDGTQIGNLNGFVTTTQAVDFLRHNRVNNATGYCSGNLLWALLLPNYCASASEIASLANNPWQLFEPKKIYIPTSISGGGGSQTLIPSFYNNTQTFYASTVTPGAVDLSPSLYNNTAIFYAPTVSTGTVSLAPTLYSNSQVFYSATITQGSVLEPSLYSNTQSFYPPSVTRGGVVLTPALFTNSGSFYAATVTNGAQALTPTRVNNSQTFYIPTISVGSVTLVPTLLNNTNVFYAASVSDGTTSSATIKAGSWIRYRIIT